MRISILYKRIAWKPLLIDPSIKDGVSTTKRYTIVTPNMVGSTIKVHNGKGFVPISVTEDHIGKKLSDYILTKKFYKYNKK